MSDRAVLDLLDRAAADAPQMYVAPDAVVSGGRRRVARRRTAAVGTAIGGMALAGVVWLGLGGSGLLGAEQELAPAQTSWEVTQDTTVTLLEHSTGLQDSQLGPIVLHAHADGTSSVDVTLDGVTTTAEGEPAIGGRATLYPGPVSILVHGSVEGARSLALGSGETGTSGEVQVGGEPFTWHALLRTDGGVAGFGDVLLVEGDDAALLSGGTVDAVPVPDDDGTLLWQVPAQDTWGVSMPGGSASTSLDSPLLETGTVDDEGSTVRWAVRTPAGAGEVRMLRHGTDEVAATQEWRVQLGGRWVSGGVVDFPAGTGWDWDAQWQGADGQWHAVQDDGDGAGPGEVVTLLGEDYTVGVDPLGWPQLIADDGSVFLRVTDEDGPSDGGMIDMTRWRWPWQPNEEIHFEVGSSGGEVVVDGEVVERVTIEGPEGSVRLTSVSR